MAFKGQRIMFVCWCDRVSYDETAYLTSSNAETHRSLINSDSNFSKPPESAVNNFTQNDYQTTSDIWLGDSFPALR